MIDKNYTYIDLRSPKEFMRGHVPTALNLPLLDNAERHHVGKTYKEKGRLEATQLGLEIFSKKSDAFLNSFLDIYSEHKKNIIYCWRGGMRSGFVGQWLKTMGFKISIFPGGYKKLRNLLLHELEIMSQHPYLVLIGRTGSGKSEFLRFCSGKIPMLDFEHIAKHRGSAFGGFAQKESPPTQEQFENELSWHYLDYKHEKRILVESEDFLGKLFLPLALRENLKNSPKILFHRTPEARIKKLTEEYTTMWQAKDWKDFPEKLNLIKKYLPKKVFLAMLDAANKNDFFTIVKTLIEYRYDPAYDKSFKKQKENIVAEMDMDLSSFDEVLNQLKYFLMRLNNSVSVLSLSSPDNSRSATSHSSSLKA